MLQNIVNRQKFAGISKCKGRYFQPASAAFCEHAEYFVKGQNLQNLEDELFCHL